tara:strand:- start:160 stop:345 length:186 start_codon:yes stop_codon:yes gene_type:complete
MAKITIDEKEYETDDLSDTAKANIASLQFVKNEIIKLNAQLAVYKTAEISYSKAVKENLES